MPAPVLADVKAYLRVSDSSRDAEIAAALLAEQADQAEWCAIPAPYLLSGATLASGSASVAGLFAASDVGAVVTHPLLPAGTTVVSVDLVSAVLSQPATGSLGSATLTLEHPWPASLTEALYRRVAHNLALRPLHLGVSVSTSEAAVSVRQVGGSDAEVERLEGPHRVVVFS